MGEYTDYLLRGTPTVTTNREKDEAIATAVNKISALVCDHKLSTDSINQLRARDIGEFLGRVITTLDMVQDQVDYIKEFLPRELR